MGKGHLSDDSDCLERDAVVSHEIVRMVEPLAKDSKNLESSVDVFMSREDGFAHGFHRVVLITNVRLYFGRALGSVSLVCLHALSLRQVMD